ncbi:MAG: phage/plasmid primase, P4 family [Bacteroidota bacterium]|nr:phage/plasmid primase, P4 family [Bacteroidota bacterium]
MENEKEATATTATTPEMLSKDNDNVQTIKVLKPKFDTLTTTELKKHVSGLTSKVEPTEHGAILTELLECFKPYDFEKSVFPQTEKLRAKFVELQKKLTNPDGSYNKNTEIESELKEIEKQLKAFKLNQKHYIIESIENVLRVAEQKKWGICKNANFIYLYNGAYWANIDKDIFQNFLGNAAERMGVAKYDSRWVEFRDKMFKQFLSASYLPKPEPVKGIVLINLKNGTFEISPKGNKLRAFDRADFLTYQLPFAYEPNATAPQYNTFLNRVLPDIERQNVLAEFLSFVFVPTSILKIEKALLLYGTGANGKSVFFDIVCALLGEENVSNFGLESLLDDKGQTRAKIADKLLNYVSELKSNIRNGDDNNKLKTLFSGEPIEARLLYCDPFTIKDYAKFIFNCNELPKNTEQTNAYFRRFLIINFDQTIPENEQDKELSNKIIATELSGVFNWVLSGLERLLKQRNFSECTAVNEARKQYELESDSVNQFIVDSGYIATSTSRTLLKDIFNEYKSFCIEDGFRPVNKKNFKKRLERMKFVFDQDRDGNFIYLVKGAIYDTTDLQEPF